MTIAPPKRICELRLIGDFNPMPSHGSGTVPWLSLVQEGMLFKRVHAVWQVWHNSRSIRMGENNLEVSGDDFVLVHGAWADVLASGQVKQEDQDQAGCDYDDGCR